MTEYLDEFKKLIEEKKISSVEEMQEESMKLAKSIPNLKEKYEKARMIRGDILENCITLETAFNELLLRTGGEDLVINHKEKTFKLITGIKEELGSLPTFRKRALAVKEIIRDILKEKDENLESVELDNFDKIAAIRDIFAHVPINWFSPELEFNDGPHYKHFFKLNPKWKNVDIACNEFLGLYAWILEAIPNYVRMILLKEQLYLTVFFGTDYKRVLEEAKKKLEESKKDSE